MAGFVGLLAGAAVVAAAGGANPADPERARIEAIVHEYILAHPEIIPEAVDRLRGRETAKLIDANRQQIETPFAGAWAGARDGDVTLVEFFDYACGYCRQSVPDIERLLASDKALKIVFRELPILGDESGQAAQASLAAAQQGRFMDFHRAMYAAGRPGGATIARASAAAKIAPAAPNTAIKTEIENNIALARTLGMTGTPTFVVGDRVLSGAVGYDELSKAVAEARAKRSR